jgi:hypothetical protein
VLVNFLLPPPMLLAFLLVLPFPRHVRKGVLIFTNSVLSFTVCECAKAATVVAGCGSLRDMHAPVDAHAPHPHTAMHGG